MAKCEKEMTRAVLTLLGEDELQAKWSENKKQLERTKTDAALAKQREWTCVRVSRRVGP